MRQRMILLTIVLTAGAACGGGGGAQDEAADGAASSANSPIAELLGFSTDPADQGAQQQQFIEQERKVQSAIAQCMRDEGFEYTPVDPAAMMSFGGMDEDIPFDSKEWAETYGLGMSFTVGGDAPEPTEMPTDPNAEYLESLSEAETSAYYKALHGDMPEFDPTEEPTEDSIGFELGGCEGEARKSTDNSTAFFNEFGDEMDELYQKAQADPAFVAATEKWSTCMDDAGYDYDDQNAMYEDASERMTALFNGAGETSIAIPDGASGAATSAVSGASTDGLGQPDPIDEEKRAEVQAWERDVAVANWECSRDLTKVQQEIMQRYEQEFIDSNRQRIDDVLAGNS